MCLLQAELQLAVAYQAAPPVAAVVNRECRRGPTSFAILGAVSSHWTGVDGHSLRSFQMGCCLHEEDTPSVCCMAPVVSGRRGVEVISHRVPSIVSRHIW